MPVLFKPFKKPDTYMSKIYIEINTCVKTATLLSDVAIIDFGTIPLGYREIRTFTLKNIGKKTMDLKM